MLVYLLPICYYSICNLALERCLRGRKSTIGNRVYVKSVPRVRIPLSPPKLKAGQRKLSYFLRRERCSKLVRCKHRPSCTRLRLWHTMTAIAVRRIPRLPPKLKAGQRKLSYFLRRERCSKPGRCKHRPSCTRLRQRRTLTAIAVRRIPLSPPVRT